MNSIDTYKAIRAVQPVFVLGYFNGPNSETNLLKYEQAGDEMEEIIFGVVSEELSRKLGMLDNEIMIVRKLDDTNHRYSIEEIDDLELFVKGNTIPLVAPFNVETRSVIQRGPG